MAGLWSGTTLPEPNNGASFDGGNGHLTGWGAAPSIDQIVAQAYGANMPYQRAPTDANPETRYRTIALGVQCGNPNSVTRMMLHGGQRAGQSRGQPEGGVRPLLHGRDAAAGCSRRRRIRR